VYNFLKVLATTYWPTDEENNHVASQQAVFITSIWSFTISLGRERNTFQTEHGYGWHTGI